MAVSGVGICPKVTLYKDFNWYDADGLFVAIRLGSRPYQVEAWIPKPGAALLSYDWSFQIPGRNVWDPDKEQLIGEGFEFADLKVSRYSNLRFESHCPESNWEMFGFSYGIASAARSSPASP